PLGGGKPNPTVHGLAAGRPLVVSFGALDRVQVAIAHAFDLLRLPVGEIIKAPPADAEETTVRVRPEEAGVVQDHGVNDVVIESILPADVAHLPVLEPGNARGHG